MKNTDNKKESVLRKIEALLAKAESTTFENEAEQAMLMAQKLMAKYSIEESELKGKKVEYEIVVVETYRNRGYRGPLANIIGQNFRCRPFYKGNDLCFFGRKEDVHICKSVMEFAYMFARRQAKKLQAERKKEGRPTANVFNPYVTGFMAGLKAKLDAQSKELMIIVPPDVNDEMNKRLNLREDKSHRMARQNMDVEAFQTGYEDGKGMMDKTRIEGGDSAAAAKSAAPTRNKGKRIREVEFQ